MSSMDIQRRHAAFPCSMDMNTGMQHGHAAWACIMNMITGKQHGHAVCPCCRYIHVACHYCMSLLLTHATCPCFMPVLHFRATHPWTCCMSTLHFHAAYQCCILCPCCMSLKCKPQYACCMSYVHAACPSCVTMLLVLGE
jgi:hypothetical protein